MMLTSRPGPSFRRPRSAADMTRDAVMAATPIQLLNMLFRRLMEDLDRAKKAQKTGAWEQAHHQLSHAQEIIAQLSATLDTDSWDGGKNLMGIYSSCSVALTNANLGRDVSQTIKVIEVLAPVEQAWVEAGGIQARSNTKPAGVNHFA